MKIFAAILALSSSTLAFSVKAANQMNLSQGAPHKEASYEAELAAFNDCFASGWDDDESYEQCLYKGYEVFEQVEMAYEGHYQDIRVARAALVDEKNDKKKEKLQKEIINAKEAMTELDPLFESLDYKTYRMELNLYAC